MQRVHPLAAAASVALSAYFALWACAPAATMRAPVPMSADSPNELGVAGAYVYTPSNPTTDFTTPTGPAGQLWYTHRIGPHVTLGGVLFAGMPTLVGAGAQLRWTFVDKERFRLGMDVEGGFLWGALGIPVAVKVADGVWAYAAPSIGARVSQVVRMPVGVGISLGERWVLTPEVTFGLGTSSGNPLTTEPSIEGGLGIATRF